MAERGLLSCINLASSGVEIMKNTALIKPTYDHKNLLWIIVTAIKLMISLIYRLLRLVTQLNSH